MLGAKYFLALFLIVFLEGNVLGAENCTNEDFQNITSCYIAANNGNVPYLTDLVAPLMTLNVTKEYWNPVCEEKKKLNDCIGKDRVDRCFDIQNIMQLSFAPVESAAKIIIASFLEIDHNCENLLKFSDEDLNCYRSSVEKITFECQAASYVCDDIMEAVNCTIQAFYDKCGKGIGCFNYKTATLQKCYVSIVCENCNNLSAANNPIKDLCHDDEIQETTAGGKMIETTSAIPSTKKPAETTAAAVTSSKDATTSA